VGGIGVTRVAVVVRGRGPVAGAAAAGPVTGVHVVVGAAPVAGVGLVMGAAPVAGLQDAPGIGVQLPEAVGPGDVGTELRFAPVARLGASPLPVGARSAHGVTPRGIWPPI